MTKIPYDITYYAKRQLLKKIVWVAILTVALAVFMAFFGHSLFGERCPLPITVILSVVICLVPCLASRLPARLLDRSFEGEITEIRVKTKFKATGRGGRSIGMPPRNINAPVGVQRQYGYFRFYSLVVKAEDGKLRRVPISSQGPNNASNIYQLYRVGDRVGHVAGTMGVYLIKENSHIRLCVICGTHGRAEESMCHYCGMPLIRAEEA